MAVKYQVFVSSTYDDLEAERNQVIRAILEMGHIPVGMEMFSAADEEQWKIITRQIDQSDYYVAIVAHRYGSIVDGISYTEKEYDYAVHAGVPVLGFQISDDASWPADRVDKKPHQISALTRFKEKLRRKPVGFWSSADDLYGKFSIALMKLMNTNPRPGWTRTTEIAGPEVMIELSRLSSENARLRHELEAAQAKGKEEEEGQFSKTLRALSDNKVEVRFHELEAPTWSDPVELSLLAMFDVLAPMMMVELSIDDAGALVGMRASGKPPTQLRKPAPVPMNHLRDWLADLATLGLVQPSTRKHSVHDTKEYWSLSAYGSDVHSRIRRARLESGIEMPATVQLETAPAEVPKTHRKNKRKTKPEGS